MSEQCKCFFCWFWDEKEFKNRIDIDEFADYDKLYEGARKGICHRYPQKEVKLESDWCGEYFGPVLRK